MSHDNVESLKQQITELVAERQALRAQGASLPTLEPNRQRILHLQWQLSHALIARHLPRSQPAT